MITRTSLRLLKIILIVNLILPPVFSCHLKSEKRHKVLLPNSADNDTVKAAYHPNQVNFPVSAPEISKPEIVFQSRSSENSVLFATWNLKDFGDSKDDAEMDFIADVIKHLDIIAVQEVVAGPGGPKAIARLADVLNRKGAKWDYTISDPTSGDNSHKRERYAFLWKPGKLKKMGDAWLEKQYNLEIDREPYFATFGQGNNTFTLVNFHAITKSKQPETEIKYFKFFPDEYPGKNLIFAGDFNCPQSHSVFNPLKKMGYLPVLVKQKTSLKKMCKDDECLASEFDNIFYNSSTVTFIQAGVIHFYQAFHSLEEASKISDHIPVVFEFSLN